METKEEASTQTAEEKPVTQTPEQKVSIADVLKAAESDSYIYDLRFYEKWDKENLRKAWDNNFSGCNSGSFSYLIPHYKRLGGAFDQLYSVLEREKFRHWRTLMQSVEKDVPLYWKWACEYAAEGDREQFENWRHNVAKNWEHANLYRTALGVSSSPKPEFVSITYEEARRMTLEQRAGELVRQAEDLRRKAREGI